MSVKAVSNGLLNLLVKRYLGPFWIRRRWLDKTQWLNREQLTQLQTHLLQKLVKHSYHTVPYYKKLMDDYGITVDDIKSVEDIQKFPILTKQDALAARDSLISTSYPRILLREAYTGGTTGTPVKIYRSLFSINNEHAFVRRQWDWAGIGFKDRTAYLSGRVIFKPDEVRSKLYVYDPIMKELILSTYHLSTDTAKDYAAAIERYKVKAIVGYASAIHFLAKTCLDTGIKLNLRSALTSSETLSDNMRETIIEAFDCKIFDFYGSAERVCYIHTCNEGRYHIIPEYGLTELIPLKNDDNSLCKVVSTGFWNYAMPLIRYELGDIVIKSDGVCTCGRAFPMIDSITGRVTDNVRTKSGRVIVATALTHLLYGADNIVESQIIQDSLDHICIEYVPNNKFSNKDLEDLKALVMQHLPSELNVELKSVAAIQRTSSGKLKPIVSKLNY